MFLVVKLQEDKLLFAACTTITVGNGRKTAFWHSAWLVGQRPKDLAPLLYLKTRHKRRSLAEALLGNRWIRDLNIHEGFTTAHLLQLVNFWILIAPTQLQPQQEDTIFWNLTPDGNYMTALAYKPQFVGCIKSPELSTIWKSWAPPKCKFFAWLILQNRVWTSDRLARRDWDHRPSCPLCRATMETAHHLVFSCRYTRRVWASVSGWTGLANLHPDQWANSESALQWWTNITTTPEIPRKATRSLALLILWEIWLERNSRVFNRRESLVPTVMAKLKSEVSLWMAAGAKESAGLTARV